MEGVYEIVVMYGNGNISFLVSEVYFEFGDIRMVIILLCMASEIVSICHKS
jgi:hypothetical protein